MPLSIVKLRCGDGHVVDVEWKLAQQSETIASTLTKGGNPPALPLTMDCPNVSSSILSLAFEWLKQHLNDQPAGEGSEHELSPWDEQFFRRLPLPTLYQLIVAADSLRMGRLMYASTKTVANMMIGKSPAEIRTIFELPDDL